MPTGSESIPILYAVLWCQGMKMSFLGVFSTTTGSESIPILYAILRHQGMQNVISGHILYFIKCQPLPHLVIEYLDTLRRQRVKNVIFGHILYFIKYQPLPHSVIEYLDTLRCQRVKNVILGVSCILSSTNHFHIQ